MLAFHKPADPVAFLLPHLTKVQALRASKSHSGFFTSEDLEALFALHAGAPAASAAAPVLSPDQVCAKGCGHMCAGGGRGGVGGHRRLAARCVFSRRVSGAAWLRTRRGRWRGEWAGKTMQDHAAVSMGKELRLHAPPPSPSLPVAWCLWGPVRLACPA